MCGRKLSLTLFLLLCFSLALPAEQYFQISQTDLDKMISISNALMTQSKDLKAEAENWKNRSADLSNQLADFKMIYLPQLTELGKQLSLSQAEVTELRLSLETLRDTEKSLKTFTEGLEKSLLRITWSRDIWRTVGIVGIIVIIVESGIIALQYL